MLRHSFSNFSYAINITSARKGHKEVLVCYVYNGIEMLKKIYISEASTTAYVFEAKKIIDNEVKDGSLASYSRKVIRKNKLRILNAKKPIEASSLVGTDTDNAPVLRIEDAQDVRNNNKTWVIVTASIAAVAIIGMSVGMYFVGKNSIPSKNTYDVKLFSPDCEFTEEVNSIKKDETLDCYIKMKDGVTNKVPNISTIHVGSTLLSTNEYNFNYFDGHLTLEVPATGDIFISASGIGEHEIVAGPDYKIEGGKAIITGVKILPDHLDDVGTLLIPEFIEEQGNKYEVTEINPGALHGLSNLTDLSLPFIGLHKYVVNGAVEESMIGAIFGDTDYAGGLPVWQDYMDYTKPEGKQHIMKKWIIPNDLSDITITGDQIYIGVGAFSECDRINDIVIKGNISKINDFAFYNCGALESVTFDKGAISDIGKYAFANCKTLTTIGQPLESGALTLNLSGVEKIETCAFLDCTGAQQTYITNSVMTIEDSAFSGTGGIILVEQIAQPLTWSKTWVGPSTAVVFGSDGELHKITDTSTSSFMFIITSEWQEDGTSKKVAYITDYIGPQYAEEVEVPCQVAADGGSPYEVHHLGVALFYQYTPIKTMKIHSDYLLSIDNYCFANCYNMETIQFIVGNEPTPENEVISKLTNIGVGAFANCRSLVIDDFDYLSGSGEDDYIDIFKYYATPTFPSSITTIGNSAFIGCSKIRNVTLPNLINLGDSAFEACASLERIKVGADTFSFGKRAFCDSSIEGIYYYQDPDGTFATGEHFTQISDECFKNTNIRKTYIGDGIIIPWYTVSIGESAFEGCSNIQNVGLEPFDDPSSGETIYSAHLKSIKANAFAKCYNLQSFDTLKYATGLSSLGDKAFQQCIKLSILEINADELKTIPTGCFDGCETMQRFICSSKISSIEERAFFGCSSLRFVFNDNGLMPATLGKLGDFAFSGCSNIVSLTITYDENESPEDFDMGVGVFSGWKTVTHIVEQQLFSFIDLDKYEVDDSNYLCIQKGWLSSTYIKDDTNNTKWGWVLNTACSYHSLTIYYGQKNVAFERYKCAEAGSNLYIHLV